MNAHILARTAYAAPTTATRTPRDLEYELLARATRRIRAASESGTADFPALAMALHENRRLWDALASDVADPGNALPQQLRAGIFYLSEFTRTHSRRVLAGEADPRALVDINTAVMRGLRPEGART